MPVRTGVAGMLGALIVVGVACLTPEPIVLREAQSASSPTPIPSPVAAAAPSSAVASPVGVSRVRVAGEVNLRAEPSMSGALLKELPVGAELELLRREVVVGGRTWRNVRDPADRSEGWVAAEFLEPAE
jgi:hypothetical protein